MRYPNVRAMLLPLILAATLLVANPNEGASARPSDNLIDAIPDSERTRPFIVTLAAETRWDAWSAALAQAEAGRELASTHTPAALGAWADGSHGASVHVGQGVRTRADARAWASASSAQLARGPSVSPLLMAGHAADAAAANVAALTIPVVEAVVQSGGVVVSRYDAALAGMLVHMSPAAAQALVGVPNVASIQPAPVVSVQLLDSVPGAGATRVHDELGFSGGGATVAIVDTGADYTHAALGGPGTVGAYTAAGLDAEGVADTWQGAPLFPNDKVVAGFDFAGPLYDPGCSSVAEHQGLCSSVPTPDLDPLDTHGHGTHVSSIAAGRASGAVGVGVAPGADIVALKIFGSSGSTDLIIDPIEWAIEANMGIGGRPHIDVLNLSVGQRYGAEVMLEQEVVRRAVDAGIVVVASVGNDSYLPFIAAAPGIAPEALAVASHNPPGQHVWTATVAPAAREPVAFESDALFHMAWTPRPRAELSAEVVYLGRGCPGNGAGDTRDPYLADPVGRIAMIDLAWGNGGPSCTADRQARRAQDAGAVGVLIAMGMGIEAASFWDGYALLDIPAWTVNQQLETTVRELSPDDVPAIMTLQQVARPDEDGVVSEFSSRGPARTGALKPNLSAPGAGVFAAAMGQGTRGVRHSGTSMAAPHVAGSAALVWSAARSRGSRLSARDVAASLVTSANPAGVHQSAERRGSPPLTRSGAGALAAYRTVTGRTGVRAGAIADLGMGLMALSDPVTHGSTITVTNRSTQTMTYSISPRYRTEQDRDAGLELVVATPTLRVEPGVSVAVPVSAHIDPESLPEWGLLGGAGVGDTDALTSSELDGWLEIAPAPGEAADVVQRVPFYVLARRASVLAATWQKQEAGAYLDVQLRNRGVFAGDAELFELVATDAPDPSLPAKIDVDTVGVRAIPDGQGNTVVEFMVHTRGARVHPLETATEIEMDTDLDGRVDYIVYTEDEAFLRTGASRNGRVKAALDEPGGSPFGSPTARFFAFVDIHGRFTGLPIVIEDTGLTPSTLHFGFRVRQRDFVEGDSAELALFDQVPNGDGWLTFDGRSRGEVPSVTRSTLEGGEDETFTIAAPSGGAGVLAIFPNNAPGPSDFAVWPELEPRNYVVLPWIGVSAQIE